jgi:hypothetical protein
MSDFIRCHCNRCGHETKHDVLHEQSTSTDEVLPDDVLVSWVDTYEMLECRGCEDVRLKHTNLFVSTGEAEVHFYPPAASRRLPVWRLQLPREIRELLEEVYTALHNDSRTLALMGLRTVLDALMLQQVGDKGSFENKLDALGYNGIISLQQSEVLRAALDAGSAAAHRGFKPERDHLNAVIDIVENLLQAVYHLRPLAEELKRATPPRPAKNRG